MPHADKARYVGTLLLKFQDPTARDRVLPELAKLYPGAEFGVTDRGGLSIVISDPELVLPRALAFNASLILRPSPEDPGLLVASKNREGTQQFFRRDRSGPPHPTKSVWQWLRAPAI